MNFAELLSEVNSITKRPDLEGRTRSTLRQAVMFAHRSNNYWRDLVAEQLITLPTTEGVLLLEDHFPRLRSIASFSGAIGGVARGEFEETAVDSLFDEYNERKKFWYFGTSTGIRYNSGGFEQALISYYVDPVVTESGFDSWIAVKYPDVIIRWATSLIFKSIGNNEEAAQELQIAQSLLQQLTTGDFNIKGI